MKPEQLDVRLPMGMLFTCLGLLLVGYGLFSSPEIYERHSFGENVNIHWGVIFAIFGACMLVLARRASRRKG